MLAFGSRHGAAPTIGRQSCALVHRIGHPPSLCLPYVGCSLRAQSGIACRPAAASNGSAALEPQLSTEYIVPAAAAAATAADIPIEQIEVVRKRLDRVPDVRELLESSLELEPPTPAVPAHPWGQGFTVEQFTAAVKALPMQRRLRWKSVYPAVGTGSRGKVYQAVDLDTGGMLAVKVVALKHLMDDSHTAALRREALVLELAAMQDHVHPNILAMQGFFFHPSPTNPRLEIFSELGCCLEDIMPGEGAPQLGVGLVQKIVVLLVRALDYLHERGVVHRDVKPANIISVGSAGTFKLIDMDTLFFTGSWAENEGDEAVLQQQQQQQQRRPGGLMGGPCPTSFSAHLAGGAAAQQLQRQQDLQQHQLRHEAAAAIAPSLASSAARTAFSSSRSGGAFRCASMVPQPPEQSLILPQQQQQQCLELNALSFAGTPDNMAPEVAPAVISHAVVLWDLVPLRAGKQVASSTPVSPAQDIWSVGTVLYELLTGHTLFSDVESPEQLYLHFSKLIKREAALPAMPQGLDCDVMAVLEACLQVDPAARPTTKELLAMEFFHKTY